MLLVKVADDVDAIVMMLVILLTPLLEGPAETIGGAIDPVVVLLIIAVGTNDAFVGAATGPDPNAVSSKEYAKSLMAATGAADSMSMTPPIGALGGLILSGLAFGSVVAASTAHASKSSSWFDGLIRHDHHQHKHQNSLHPRSTFSLTG